MRNGELEDRLKRAEEVLRLFDKCTPIDAVPKEVWDALRAYYNEFDNE